VDCTRGHSTSARALETQRRRRAPKPAVVVEPVKAPEPTPEPGVSVQRQRFKVGGLADTVRIDSGTAKRIDAMLHRIFIDPSKRIGHERPHQDAAA
jgi:hypothetical protein